MAGEAPRATLPALRFSARCAGYVARWTGHRVGL